jgi:hypothetical protein
MELQLEGKEIPAWMSLAIAGGKDSAAAWESVISDFGVQGLLDELFQWEEVYLDNHKKSQHILHKAAFLVDIGVTVDEPRMENFIAVVQKHISAEGIFQTRIKTYERFGGSGEIEWSWMLCDAPLLTYIAIKSGGVSSSQMEPVLRHLLTYQGEEGWLCTVDPEMGKFRGPGGAKQICPYATLLMLKLKALFPEYHESGAVHHGVEALLALWDDRKKRKPFLFAMGTDFKKAKAPLIWYDLLHVLMVLTEFEWVRGARQIQEMTEILKSKIDENGLVVPESVYLPWKTWEFGQKKEPSIWVSFLVHHILNRMA